MNEGKRGRSLGRAGHHRRRRRRCRLVVKATVLWAVPSVLLFHPWVRTARHTDIPFAPSPHRGISPQDPQATRWTSSAHTPTPSTTTWTCVLELARRRACGVAIIIHTRRTLGAQAHIGTTLGYARTMVDASRLDFAFRGPYIRGNRGAASRPAKSV